MPKLILQKKITLAGVYRPVIPEIYNPVLEELKALGIEKGSSKAREHKAGTLTKAQVAEIVKEKMPDLRANNPEAAARVIAGTARSMGVEVK